MNKFPSHGLFLALFSTMLLCFALSPATHGQDKKEAIAITKEEQEAITQAFVIKQQAQAKINELKKLRESVLQPIDAAIRQAESDDANALIMFQNIELKIGNAHGFDPSKFDRTERDGKLVYTEKTTGKVEKAKEGK